MKKRLTTLFVFGALLAFNASNVFSQVPEFDNLLKYYLIINHNSQNAVGFAASDADGALIQQQVRDESDGQLWQVIEASASTYYFINKGSGKALGVADWRGDNPFWEGSRENVTSEQKDEQLTVPSFNWNGVHRGVIQTEKIDGEPTQIWEPSEFPTTSKFGDTTVYRMTLSVNLADSGLSFNIWERRILPGYRNICLFPGVTGEASLYNDYTTLYAFYFVKTNIDVPVESVADVPALKFDVYNTNGLITIKGNIVNQTIEVYSILGTKVHSALATSPEINFQLNKGVYLVKAGNSVTKIFIQ